MLTAGNDYAVDIAARYGESATIRDVCRKQRLAGRVGNLKNILAVRQSCCGRRSVRRWTTAQVNCVFRRIDVEVNCAAVSSRCEDGPRQLSVCGVAARK